MDVLRRPLAGVGETWYVLFDGTSADGRGDARFVGRTTDAVAAALHAKKCEKSPYCTGYVLKITDAECVRFTSPKARSS